jgi:hypothetical protein
VTAATTPTQYYYYNDSPDLVIPWKWSATAGNEFCLNAIQYKLTYSANPTQFKEAAATVVTAHQVTVKKIATFAVTDVTITAYKGGDGLAFSSPKSQTFKITGVAGTCGDPKLTIASTPAAINYVYYLNTDNSGASFVVKHTKFTSSDPTNCDAKDAERPHYKLTWDYTAIGTVATYVGTSNTDIGALTIAKTNENKYVGKWVGTISAIG